MCASRGLSLPNEHQMRVLHSLKDGRREVADLANVLGVQVWFVRHSLARLHGWGLAHPSSDKRELDSVMWRITQKGLALLGDGKPKAA